MNDAAGSQHSGRNSLLKKTTWDVLKEGDQPTATNFSPSELRCSRLQSSLIYRLKLDSLKTKYVKNIKCVCGAPITINHLLLDCHTIRAFLPQTFTKKPPTRDTLSAALIDLKTINDIAKALINCPVHSYL